MRSLRILTISFVLLAMAGIALAGCPLQGTYTSAAGEMLNGRAAESWPGGIPGDLGNTVLANSWDDVELGAQWQLNCVEICVAPVLTENTVDEFGNGHHIYFTQYCGGEIVLTGDGQPWYNGDALYTAAVVEASFTVTVEIEGGVPVSHVSVIDILGDVLDCTGVCIELNVTNAVQAGEGVGTDFPAGYPLPHTPVTCTEDGSLLGTWWDISDITMLISGCTVPTVERNWGEVKSLYR